MATRIPPPLRADVVRLIWQSARRGNTITYGRVMSACHIPRGQPKRNGKSIGDVVGAISEWTWQKWGIYLSALVVHKETGFPGGGFLGLYGIPSKLARDEVGWRDRTLTLEEKAFIQRCQEDAFAWAKRRKVTVRRETIIS